MFDVTLFFSWLACVVCCWLSIVILILIEFTRVQFLLNQTLSIKIGFSVNVQTFTSLTGPHISRLNFNWTFYCCIFLLRQPFSWAMSIIYPCYFKMLMSHKNCWSQHTHSLHSLCNIPLQWLPMCVYNFFSRYVLSDSIVILIFAQIPDQNIVWISVALS